MSRITLTLQEDERNALLALSRKEFRDPRSQASLIIRQELQKQGFLPLDDCNQNDGSNSNE